MKNTKKAESKDSDVKSSTFCLFTLAFILCFLVFLLYGCAQLGETEAEGRRRHLRASRINKQELMEDIDTCLLLDKPSKLTDKRIP